MKVFVFYDTVAAETGDILVGYSAPGIAPEVGSTFVSGSGVRTPHELLTRTVDAVLADIAGQNPNHGVQPHEVCVPVMSRG